MACSRVHDNNLNTSGNQENVADCDEEEDDNEGPTTRAVTFSKNCCVRTVLVIVVVTTAIVLVTIVASYKKQGASDGNETAKTAVPRTESVYWRQSNGHKRLVFEHQFLIRNLDNQRPLQIVAIDEVRRKYVIVWYDMSKYFNLYMTADFIKNTETILVVSKSFNAFATDVKENTVLFCETKRFDRTFHGSFATVTDVTSSSGLELNLRDNNLAYAVTYIGGPLTLDRLISTVVNSSCEDLMEADVFKWTKPDESQACGDRVHSEGKLHTCSRDLCQTFPGIPQSKGQICQMFRSCNYLQKSCDPYYRQNPSKMETRPYCVCRKTAAQNAERLSCPKVADDGGECEIPRRELMVAQWNLPCLCLYTFRAVYPYRLKSVPEINSQAENTDQREYGALNWYTKEWTVTGSALQFSQCPC